MPAVLFIAQSYSWSEWLINMVNYVCLPVCLYHQWSLLSYESASRLRKYIAGICFHLFFWCISLNPSFQNWICLFCLFVISARWATILQLLLIMLIPDMVGPFGRRLKSPASSVANTSQSCHLVSLGHCLSLLWPAVLGRHSQLIKLFNS